METYSLQGDAFVIRDYDLQSPFTSFLPGLAGVQGIPLWTFYVNRGQGMVSFGIHNKANAMMEFSPANTGYETVQLKGFRTLLRVNGELVQPFFRPEEGVSRTMTIRRNALTVAEERPSLRMTVTYYVLPEEEIGALVRRVKLENTGSAPLSLEILDGMPQILPYGIENSQYKEMSNLFKSWADIRHLEKGAPIFTMRASNNDSAEVTMVTGGYYYAAYDGAGAPLPIVYDRSRIFGSDQSLMDPLVFAREGLAGVRGEQVFANKVPCAFAAETFTLAPGAAWDLTAYAGYTPSEALLDRMTPKFSDPAYPAAKYTAALAQADALTKDIRTCSGDKLFDQYVEQCYLDNFLRGGYPFFFGEGTDKKVVHLFSRKHGDPERDYNFFSIAGEFFSQGNGNYRDVCQNRRHDVSFHPEVEDFDLRNFFSLIQLDGYNPLEIRPCTFVLRPGAAPEALVREYLADPAPVLKVLEKPFTPGEIPAAAAKAGLTFTGDPGELTARLLALCDQRFEAGAGEGYWTDHFDYDLDLLEDYLSVWPDKKQETLFEKPVYRIYDNALTVRPGLEKTCITPDGRVRQYGAILEDEEKAARPGFDPKGTNWVKDAAGTVVETTLWEKLLLLAGNKMAALDPELLGVSMEAGKPGWNDAMNGLPGLFGSSMAETLELRRVVKFALAAAKEQPGDKTCTLLGEVKDFLFAVGETLAREDPYFALTALREDYRVATRFGVSGAREEVTFGALAALLAQFAAILEDAVARGLALGEGIMPTFFTYEATAWEPILDAQGAPVITPYGLPAARVTAFARRDLPLFLEGPARYLSSCGEEDLPTARAMAAKVRESGLYDRALKMYKTSVSLEGESFEIGRIRAFTPGWLERESVFLHMEYKYIVGLMKAGLAPELFTALGESLIPHLDPAVYGRSILENSSFIATSVNPDPSVRGKGFQARLSGSTVETLTLWKGLFVGAGGFEVKNGALAYRFAPVLSGSFFDDRGDAAFTLCGKVPVTYHDPSRKDTFGPDPARVTSVTVTAGERTETFPGDSLPAPWAAALRAGELTRIDVQLA